MARSEILDATTPESRDAVVKYIKTNYPDLKNDWEALYEMTTTPFLDGKAWQEKAKSLSGDNKALHKAFYKVKQVVKKNESGNLDIDPDTWQVGVVDFDPSIHIKDSKKGTEDKEKLKTATSEQQPSSQIQDQKKTSPIPTKQSTYMDAVNRGIALGFSRLDQLASNVLGMFPSVPFIPSPSKALSERSAQIQKEVEEQYGAPAQGETGKEIVEAISGTPVDILRYSVGTRALGPLLGPALTEYMSNIHLGHDKATKAMWHGLAMGLGAKYGGKAMSKMYGKTMLKNVNLLPNAVRNRLPAGFVDALKEMAEEGAGAGVAGTGMRVATGEGVTPGNVLTDVVVGATASRFPKAAEKVAGRVAKEYRDYRDWKKGKPAPRPTTEPTTEVPPMEEPAPSTSQASAEQPEGVLPKTKNNTVIDPLTNKPLQLDPNEFAVFVEDTTYIFKPRGVEGKYDVFEASTEGGDKRRLLGTSRDVTDLAAEAARLRKQKASLGKEPEPYPRPKADLGDKEDETAGASLTPGLTPESTRSSMGLPPRSEKKPTATPSSKEKPKATPPIFDKNNEQYREAVIMAKGAGEISTGMLQRNLKVSYADAEAILNQMYADGIIKQPAGAKKVDFVKAPEWLSEPVSELSKSTQPPTPPAAPAPLESVYSVKLKGQKDAQNITIKFDSEEQKNLFDILQKAYSKDPQALAKKQAEIDKYAKENNVSAEQAKKTLEGWSSETYNRAAAEAGKGKKEVKANAISKDRGKTKATPPPPPVAETPAAAPVATPETVTTETVVAPSQETPAPPSEAALAASSAALSAPKSLQQLWEIVQTGAPVSEGSIYYGLLSAAGEIKKRGGLKDYDEFYKFTNEYRHAGKNARTSMERESKKQKLVDKYSPKGTPAPATPAPPPPVVETSTRPPQVEPPAVIPEASVASTPTPAAPPAKKTTGKKKAEPPAEPLPVVSQAKEEVAAEPLSTAIPTGMVEAAAAGTAARVKPPVPEGSEGMQSYSIRQNTPLYFENSSDLAIAKSGGKSQDLRKHVNKLGLLLLDGKPIVMQPDKAVQLMRDYRSHLTEAGSGIVPSIEEFATTIWKEKGRAALPQEPTAGPKTSTSKEEKKLDKDIASINEQIEKQEAQRRSILNTQPDVSRGVTQRMITADALVIADKIKKLKGQLSTLLWRKQRGLTGQIAQTAKQPEPIAELANIRRSTESLDRIADNYEKELGQINKQIGEVVSEKIKLKGEAGRPASQEVYANQLKNTIEKYQQDLNVLKQERAAREAERKENDSKSADISEQIKDLSPQDPVYINGKKRIGQLSQRNQQLTEEIGSRDARQKQVEGDIENETVKLNSGKLPTQIEIDKDIARLDAKLEQLKKDRDKTDASLSQAKKDSASNKSLLDSFLKSEAGKAAIEQEKKSQSEKQKEQKRISEWSKRYRSSAIPGFETVERPPMAGTFAEQVQKMEPAAVPEHKAVPTVESLARNKVKIQDISEALEEAKRTLTIRRRFEDTQTSKLDDLLEQIESQHDAVLAVSGGEPSVSSIKRAQSQLANEQKRLEQLNKNIEQAQASLKRGNLSDVRKRILEGGIRNRMTSVNILKESIARLNLIIEKIPGVPESYTAEQALKRRGVGTFSAAQIREQNRLDKLTEQFYQINENLKKYREKNLNKSYQDVQQLSKKLLDLHAEHSQMRERLSEVPGMTNKDINKLLEGNIKSISKLGQDTDAVGKKYSEAIEDIGNSVAKLREKFEKTTAAKESESQGPKTPESAITDEAYEKAVNATKEKKNVTRPFLRSVLSEYKLGKKSIDALMNRMKSEGIIDKAGIFIEKAKPEPQSQPKAEPKPVKEAKPKQARKKEEVKPETKPEAKPEEKKTVKESPEIKVSGSKFAREEDAKMHQAWVKSPDSFIRDNPGMAQKAINQLVEANEGLNKQKAMLALGRYMEAANSMVIHKKPVPSLLDWYNKNK